MSASATMILLGLVLPGFGSNLTRVKALGFGPPTVERELTTATKGVESPELGKTTATVFLRNGRLDGIMVVTKTTPAALSTALDKTVQCKRGEQGYRCRISDGGEAYNVRVCGAFIFLSDDKPEAVTEMNRLCDMSTKSYEAAVKSLKADGGCEAHQ